MKHLKHILLGLALAGIVSLGAGCASVATAPNEQLIITTAAAVGTTIAVTPPTGSVSNIPYFQAGESVLTVLGGETNTLSVTAITAAIDNAGAGNNEYVSLVTPLVLNILNTDLENSGTNSVVASAQLKSACSWLATGIGQGLPKQVAVPVTAEKLDAVLPKK